VPVAVEIKELTNEEYKKAQWDSFGKEGDYDELMRRLQPKR